MVASRAPPSERGMALATYTALFDLGLLIGGPLLGLVLELSTYRAMFATAAALALSGLISFAIWDRGSG
jgi:predicted MFS family arabinose efflux permease